MHRHFLFDLNCLDVNPKKQRTSVTLHAIFPTPFPYLIARISPDVATVSLHHHVVTLAQPDGAPPNGTVVTGATLFSTPTVTIYFLVQYEINHYLNLTKTGVIRPFGSFGQAQTEPHLGRQGQRGLPKDIPKGISSQHIAGYW